jgi:hypothetical protein
MVITQERLRELLHYDPDTGLFTWKVDRRGTAKAGSVAGGPNSDGYIQIRVLGKRYKAHQLAWLYCNGVIPKEIDHEDTDKSNNRIKNLRPSTRSQNRANTKAACTNKSGFKGVSLHKSSNKYIAQIKIKGKKKSIGYFDSPEKAHTAYCEAACDAFGEFARFN